uniref:LEA type 2 family protein n=1 Tax=Alistipes sp. TaxID=1872444 RepID=UPI004056A330
MKQALHLSLLLLSLTLVSCGGLAERLGPISDLRIEQHGSVGVDIEATMGNPTAYKLQLKEATLYFYYAGEPIAHAELVRPVVVPRRGNFPIESRWRLRSEDPALMQLLLRRIEEKSYEAIEVGIEAKVRMGWFKKRFSIEKRPLSDFLRTFEVENDPKR